MLIAAAPVPPNIKIWRIVVDEDVRQCIGSSAKQV